jgi:hypothetical protein
MLTQTLHFLDFQGGFKLITGLHSVIQYHSKISQFGQKFENFSNKLSGHFSAQTTLYLILSNFLLSKLFKIIFKNVGVDVKAVVFVKFIKFEIVLLSFGSGV